MIKIIKSEKVENIVFCPSYKEANVSLEWLDDFRAGVKKCVFMVEKYVEIKKLPEFVFMSEELTSYFKKQMSLEQWVKALTHELSIYFMYGYSNIPDWIYILAHELFHASLNQIGDSSVIPLWFNESIAYYIGKKESFCIKKDFFKEFEHLFYDIKKQMLNDTLLYRFMHWDVIVKAYGTYLCSVFQPNVIKQVLSTAGRKKDLNASILEITGKDLEATIDEMAAWLKTLVVCKS